MPKDYADQPRTAIRRADRAVTDEKWIRHFLHKAAFGTLATVYEEQPFINTNLYVYDEDRHAIYLHTARVGRTRANLESSNNVCFSVSEVGRILPADEALEFSVEYAGVTVYGRAHIISDPVEAEHGLQLLLDKYAPHLRPNKDYRPITADEIKRTGVYRIDIEEWSGKRKQAPEDFAGAFYYEGWVGDNPITYGG